MFEPEHANSDRMNYDKERMMKTCTIFGDLSSERSSENYPVATICDDCVAADKKMGDRNQIVQVGEFDGDLGDECEFCGKTLEEELEEGPRPTA